MAWNYLDYARHDCKLCEGGGIVYETDWMDWGMTSIPVHYPEICECIVDRLINVQFKYYPESTFDDIEYDEKEVPF